MPAWSTQYKSWSHQLQLVSAVPRVLSNESPLLANNAIYYFFAVQG